MLCISNQKSNLIIALVTVIFFVTACLYSADDNLLIRRIHFEGNNFFSERQLKRVMELKSSNFINSRILGKESVIYNAFLLERDLEKIKNLYKKNGFAFVEIESEVKITKKNRVDISINIEEKDFVRVNQIVFEFEKNETYYISEKDLKSNLVELLRDRLKIDKNERFYDDMVHDSIDLINNYFIDLGYPHTKVDFKLELDKVKKLCDIHFIIDQGPKGYFSLYSITGNNKTDANVIEKKILFKKGDIFDRNLLRITQKNISRLGLFRSVSVNPLLESKSSEIPVSIFVNELPNYTTRIGLGYGREDRIRTFFELTRVRFLGGARRFVFFAKHSALEPISIEISFFQPMIFDSNIDFSWSPYYKVEKEPSFELERIGTGFNLNKYLSENDNIFLTYNFENNKLLEVFEEESSDNYKDLYRKSSISAGYLRDTAQPMFYPSRGIIFSTNFTLSGLGLKSDYHFYKILVDFRKYRQISDFIIIAGRLKIGSIFLWNNNDFIPVEERFYSGGIMSVRGWKRSMLGPLAKDNSPLGGNSLMESNLELRFPVWRFLSGVIFFDSGNVWVGSKDHAVTDLRYASGVGLRFRTPLGPIGLDLGKPVFESQGEWQIYFNIGQSF